MPLPAVPALLDGLKDPEALVRHQAIRTLGSLGPAAQEAVPALTEAMKDPDGGVRLMAWDALRKIKGQ